MLAAAPMPRIQFFDNNGEPLDGGFVYTCIPGGTTNDLKASYQDADGTIANTNPIVLDSSGRCLLFLDGFYHIFVYDKDMVEVFNVDNISAAAFTAIVSAQWTLSALTPTYVNSVSFTVPGNQASLFEVGLRIKAFQTSGTIFGTVSGITVSGSPTITTITCILDSGTFDSGLSSFYTGIITATSNALAVIPVSSLNANKVLTFSDLNKSIVTTGAVDTTLTMPTAIPSGCWLKLFNAGAGTVTLNGTINGEASPTVIYGSGADLFFDGTDWWGSFFNPTHGLFKSTLTVGSELSPTMGTTRPFHVDNSGDIYLTGGADDIANIFAGSTKAITLNSTNGMLISTRGFMGQEPTDDFEIATKKYIDDIDTALSADVALLKNNSVIRLIPSCGSLMWMQDGYESVAQNWLTFGWNNPYSYNRPETADGSGGYFVFVYLTEAADVYFTLLDTILFGNGNATVEYPCTWGVRIGVGGHSISSSGAYMNYVTTNTFAWVAPYIITPTAFTDPFMETGITYSEVDGVARIVPYILLGPVTLPAGPNTIFVQGCAYYPSGNKQMRSILVQGGLYMSFA